MRKENLPKPGQTISFLYPRHNFRGIASSKEQRRAVVKHVRDMRLEKPDPAWKGINPTLNRGRWLVVCDDLDKGSERSFYLESMQEITEVLDPIPTFIPCELKYVVVDRGEVQFQSSDKLNALVWMRGQKRGLLCKVLQSEITRETQRITRTAEIA